MNRIKGHKDIVGVIPAAGNAARLQPLPCSKEIFPVGFNTKKETSGKCIKPVCSHLLESMSVAGVTKAFFVLRKGKWDIPNYLGDGKAYGLHLAYLTVDSSSGVPFTIDQAFPFMNDVLVVFGFPDILFEPKDAFVHLVKRQAETGADIVLGLFPAPSPTKMDMVEFDRENHVLAIHPKPTKTRLTYTWILAVWTPRFTRFSHQSLLTESVSAHQTLQEIGEDSELYVGHVIQEAIDEGLQVEAVIFSEGRCLDLGTPEDLLKAVRKANYQAGNVP
jgi:glucose-1-phosphate thymidylyltransferase